MKREDKLPCRSRRLLPAYLFAVTIPVMKNRAEGLDIPIFIPLFAGDFRKGGALCKRMAEIIPNEPDTGHTGGGIFLSTDI